MVGPWSCACAALGSAHERLGVAPGDGFPARLGVAFAAVLLFLLVCALQHAQDFPPVHIHQHALQRDEHVRANRIQKPGLIFGGLVLEVALVFRAQRSGFELPMQLQAHLRAAQKIAAAECALQITVVGVQVHRAPPAGGRGVRQAMQVGGGVAG